MNKALDKNLYPGSFKPDLTLTKSFMKLKKRREQSDSQNKDNTRSESLTHLKHSNSVWEKSKFFGLKDRSDMLEKSSQNEFESGGVKFKTSTEYFKNNNKLTTSNSKNESKDNHLRTQESTFPRHNNNLMSTNGTMAAHKKSHSTTLYNTRPLNTTDSLSLLPNNNRMDNRDNKDAIPRRVKYRPKQYYSRDEYALHPSQTANEDDKPNDRKYYLDRTLKIVKKAADSVPRITKTKAFFIDRYEENKEHLKKQIREFGRKEAVKMIQATFNQGELDKELAAIRRKKEVQVYINGPEMSYNTASFPFPLLYKM